MRPRELVLGAKRTPRGRNTVPDGVINGVGCSQVIIFCEITTWIVLQVLGAQKPSTQICYIEIACDSYLSPRHGVGASKKVLRHYHTRPRQCGGQRGRGRGGESTYGVTPHPVRCVPCAVRCAPCAVRCALCAVRRALYALYNAV